MQPNESPFPPYWYGTSLENVGLKSVRPRVGTYGKYEFSQLPPVPFQMRGELDWLTKAHPRSPNINDIKEVENLQALKELQKASEQIQLKLPNTFTKFMGTPSLYKNIRSNTNCCLDLCPLPILSPITDGYLVRFLADSQGCLYWYLYLNKDGSDHAVVASPDFYGTEAEQWQDKQPEPSKIVFTAESFEIFLCRFWLENEIWFSKYDNTPMIDVGIAYIENYLHKHA